MSHKLSLKRKVEVLFEIAYVRPGNEKNEERCFPCYFSCLFCLYKVYHSLCFILSSLSCLLFLLFSQLLVFNSMRDRDLYSIYTIMWKKQFHVRQNLVNFPKVSGRLPFLWEHKENGRSLSLGKYISSLTRIKYKK